MTLLRTLLLASGLAVVLTGAVACGDDSDDEATPTATQAEPTPAATSTLEGGTGTAEASPSPTATESADAAPSPSSQGPEAPGDVTLSGALPDLNTPVPPGEGEQGRLTIEWTDNSDDEDGFRVYQECDGSESVLLEVGADETSYGPFQTCRPGRVGVAAFNASGESEIAWAS